MLKKTSLSPGGERVSTPIGGIREREPSYRNCGRGGRLMRGREKVENSKKGSSHEKKKRENKKRKEKGGGVGSRSSPLGGEKGGERSSSPLIL